MANMITRADAWAIERLDLVTTWAQREGWSLAVIIVAVRLGFIGSVIAHRIDWVIVVLIGFALFTTFWQWHEWRDYQESARKCQHLNALSQYNRDHSLWIRVVTVAWTAIDLPLLIGMPAYRLVPEVLELACLVTSMYLPCCRWLGPGEFGKARRERFAAVPKGAAP